MSVSPSSNSSGSPRSDSSVSQCMDFLDRFQEKTPRMSHERFEVFTRLATHFISTAKSERDSPTEEIDTRIKSILEKRKAFQKKAFFPYCTTLYGKNGGPEFELIDWANPPQGWKSFKTSLQKAPLFYLSPTAAAEFASIEDSLNSPSEQQLHTLTRLLSQLNFLVALNDISDGCWERVAMMKEILVLLGVPEKLIQKQFLYIPRAWRKGPMKTWINHVAIVFTIKGKKWIIDPAVSPNKALPLDQWISRFTKTPFTTHSKTPSKKPRLPIVNRGTINFPQTKTESLSFDRTRCFTFTTSCETYSAEDIDKSLGRGNLILQKDYDAQELTLVTLTDLRKPLLEERLKLEESWLKA